MSRPTNLYLSAPNLMRVSVEHLSSMKKGSLWRCFAPLLVSMGEQLPPLPCCSPTSQQRSSGQLFPSVVEYIQWAMLIESMQIVNTEEHLHVEVCSMVYFSPCSAAGHLKVLLNRLVNDTATSTLSFCSQTSCQGRGIYSLEGIASRYRKIRNATTY